MHTKFSKLKKQCSSKKRTHIFMKQYLAIFQINITHYLILLKAKSKSRFKSISN